MKIPENGFVIWFLLIGDNIKEDTIFEFFDD